MTAVDPEDGQSHDEPGQRLRLPALTEPRKGGTEVLVLGLERVEVEAPAAPRPLDRCGDAQKVRGVAVSDLVGFAARLEAFARVCANRLQHREARLAVARLL